MYVRTMLLLLLISISSCSTKQSESTDDDPLKIDTTRVSIIKYDPANIDCRNVFENATNAQLNNADLKKIEAAIDRVIEKQQPKQMELFERLSKDEPQEHFKREDFVLKKEEYIRRYMVVTNAKGEKEVYVAMVCDDIAKDFDMRHTINQGRGGGSCLFSFTLNIDQNKYYEVFFNTEA